MISDAKVGPDMASLTLPGRKDMKLKVLIEQPSYRHGKLREMLGGPNARTNFGTCLIVFAVPLLVPGITLTAVAFDDNAGFDKYGALHVLGMIILCMAGIFIIVGISLSINCRNEVSPENILQSISTHEKSNQNNGPKNSATRVSQAEERPTEMSSGASGTSKTTAPAANLRLNHRLVESGHNVQREDHVRFKDEEVGAFPPLGTKPNQHISLVGVNNGYLSSTDDDDDNVSDNTDDRSSGSYILPQESEANLSATISHKDDRNSVSIDDTQFRDLHREEGFYFKENLGCDEQVYRLGKLPPIEKSYSKSSIDSPSHSMQLNNNTFRNKEDIKRPNNLSLGNGTVLRKSRIKSRARANKCRTHNSTSQDSFDSSSRKSSAMESPQQNSPRVRLGGFSNASALASSLQMSNSEELLPKNLGVENFGSNASVFSNDDKIRDEGEFNINHLQERANIFSFEKPQSHRGDELIPQGATNFSFDEPQSHRGDVITQETGCVVTDNHDMSEFTAKSHCTDRSAERQVKGNSNQNIIFNFHVTEDSDPSAISGMYSPEMFHSGENTPGPIPAVHLKSKSKKRQAFSFPQSKSISPPAYSHTVRQSAPPSLLVPVQDGDCV